MKITAAISGRFALLAAAYKQLAFLRWLICITIAVFCICILSLFFKAQKTVFAFAKESCINSVTIFPNIYTNSSDNVQVKQKQTITVLGYPVISRQTCYSFLKTPSENTKINFAIKVAGSLQKKYEISVPAYPNIKGSLLAIDKIPTQKPIELELDKPDSFFNYELTANNNKVSCVSIRVKELSCDVSKLTLEHAKEYNFSLIRQYKNSTPIQVAAEKALTVTPITITSSSISNNEVRYDSPVKVEFQTDKEIDPTGTVTIIGNEKQIAASITIEKNKITAEFDKPLPRGATITVTIKELSSNDGSTLANPYSLRFVTSTGPRVVGKNITDRAVQQSGVFRLTFDQALKADINVAKFLSISSSGKDLSFKATVTGKTISISPNENLGFCKTFSIKVNDAIPNSFGIAGGSAWVFNSRTDCANIFSIGSSVNGRAITAYKFGSGPKILLFTGTMHGDESNTKRLLDKWIYELQGNPQKIPADKALVIIPVINPDGYSVGTRVNSRNVDLNRNFPADNWKASVKMPSGQTLPQGGGASSLSEPESQALSSFVANYSPKLVLAYHSRGGVVVANDVSGAWQFAKTYGNISGYRPETNASLGNFFAYDTTGAFEDWLADKKGLPAVLVELITKEDDEFNKNKNAMWQMVANY